MGVIITIGLIIIIGIIVIWTIATYNSFITLSERVNNSKSQIAAQIESRWDAVQNLINATKQYADYEATTLDAIVEKRARIGNNSSIAEIKEDDAQLNNVVSRLIALSENYPKLRASEVYQNTMDSINQYEDYVRNARMIYNDTVTMFNRKTKMFPSSIIANSFNFKERTYFEGTDTKQSIPNWD